MLPSLSLGLVTSAHSALWDWVVPVMQWAHTEVGAFY